ncbi:hypothetical protein [Aneurinibacillus migulanus]|uniref:hypothetical protein n=1 Tax=Aneurinibacillus migulanus TaxID=47500 RepID=UPI00209E1ED7|nr:hypothetical protein [Aneurinibacillus migulanus]MCP1358675.1 hypothetical protein [Aneurinibacillus migulanus]
MKRKTLIKFYTCMVLIGFNAILWAYMWQEFKQTRADATASRHHPQPKTELTESHKMKQQPADDPVITSERADLDSSVVQKKAGGEEAAAFLAYERSLHETEYAEGKRDKYASLVEEQILNGQRSNEIDYTVLKDANAVFRDISKRLNSIEISGDISEQSKNAAYQAKTGLSESYWNKADAIVSLANFLDTNDVEWKKKYERKIEKSEKYKQDSINALRVQKTKLGISK